MPDHLLVSLLRRCYSTSSCRRPSSHRSIAPKRLIHISTSKSRPTTDTSIDNHSSRTYATSVKQEEIAVLGGGITGLATAYYLSKEVPKAKVTLYEAGESLGGWLRSKYIDIGTGKVLFEQGPRSLRPSRGSGVLTSLMAYELGLANEIITTSKHAIAAKNRYVYYPDRLVTMPSADMDLLSSLRNWWSEPIFKGSLVAIAREISRSRRPDDLQDESVGSFLRRRLGTPSIGENIVSAILHGIYAGDIEELSVKSLMPGLWWHEGKYGSFLKALWKQRKSPTIREEEVELMNHLYRNTLSHDVDLKHLFAGVSVYSFKKGLGSLSKALEKYLRQRPNIQIKTGHTITQLQYQAGQHAILVKSDEPKSFSRVISTLPGGTLSILTRTKRDDWRTALVPTLAEIPSVTVAVVNLYYRNPDLLPAHGFGYLIPQSVPCEQNPECALGVVFDSDAMPGQDSVPGTKVTVMLGGHWWNEISPKCPTEDGCASMAKAVLKRHLRIKEAPAFVMTSLQRDCIPQYTVGHTSRLNKAHQDLLKAFHGRLAVAGNSYTGVGVNDCVNAGRNIAVKVKNAMFGASQITGLEQFTREINCVPMPCPPTWD